MDKPDQPTIYNRYNKEEDRQLDLMYDQQKWRNDLARDLSHKATDIPKKGDDVGDINITNSRSGMGLKEMALIAAAMVGSGGMVGYFSSNLINQANPPAVHQPTVPAIDTDTKYDLRFVEPK